MQTPKPSFTQAPDARSTAMTAQFNVAVVGATGQVGTVMREILAERSFPIRSSFAASRSPSKT